MIHLQYLSLSLLSSNIMRLRHHHFFRLVAATAATIALFSGATVTSAEAAVPTGLSRIGGPDRYALSAAVSAETFDSGVQYAFIASGENFPDALSASAASRGFGPVLLVTRDAVPSAIAAELSRLTPGKIIIVGGTDSISLGVEATLSGYAPALRLGGPDRYAVSSALSKAMFGGTFVPTIYVASGETFPDALSGSAGTTGDGPVLLVTRDGIPSPVAAELERHESFEIVVVGGRNSVSDATFAAISAYASPTTRVVRVDGDDRYAVSAAVSHYGHSTGAPTVYVASGTVFPDALSGSAAAIMHGAPVLLVTKDGIPDAVKTELDRLNPLRIIVLGGPNTVSDALLPQLARYIVV
ncbi:cell wall-binding repeat-containing protein [Herbiconiux sp. CPCC 205763]|uniref:Cell wall-binding repeat-containing protein n=1 Tax=Herbiconiux aconitum TaxID=2970913 RepID=A0ABT2GKZ4_9MICO|nr:cell wall-binding repeat-containing protein [Herbiconiux aconitum]MCS5716889.1 cell wall-binding repeat-containing protein [Herbiconiux aconitum]